MEAPAKRVGWVHFDSWAGRTRHRVEVLKETPKRYRVRLLEACFRYPAGKILYAPKYAVTLEQEEN